MKRLTPFYCCSLTVLPSRMTSKTLSQILLPFVVGNDHTTQEVCLAERVGATLSTIEPRNGQPLTLRLAEANTASGFKTGWLKNGVKLPLLNFHVCCGSPRASGNGFGWLPVCLSNPKAPSRAYSGDVQAQHPRYGFAVATARNLSSYHPSIS